VLLRLPASRFPLPARNSSALFPQVRQLAPGFVQQVQAVCPDCLGAGSKVTLVKDRKVRACSRSYIRI
jgi:hypothetical protein